MADTSKFIKDPDAVLDFGVGWEQWLNGDTLATVEWDVPEPLTLEIQSNTDQIAFAWLGGGVAGTTYPVRCHVTTNGGRTEDRTIEIICQER